jgi:NAD(P)-dependent dehydrogenase (short-subunit alcohol dehydrogenase family)
MTHSKLALVTGGSRGLGRDIALSVARRGIDVVLTYKTAADKAESVVAEIERAGSKAAALPLDLSQISSLDGFLARLKATLRERWNTESIDFLVNNAGIGAAVPIAELTEETFDAFANIHFKGVVFLTQKILTMMNEGGGVVFITAAATRSLCQAMPSMPRARLRSRYSRATSPRNMGHGRSGRMSWRPVELRPTSPEA